MFSPIVVQISALFLAAVCVGSLVYVFVGPYLTGEKRAEDRIQSVQETASTKKAKRSQNELVRKRRDVEQSLKDLEDGQKAKTTKKVSQRIRILQAGLDFPVQTFYVFSAIFGLIGGAVVYLSVYMAIPDYAIPVSLAAAVSAGLGFPRWLLNFLAGKRQDKFLEEFPNAIDVIVRGVKSGLPLNDCLNMIGRDSAEPVRSEFERICNQQRAGVPLSEALEKLHDRVPLSEVNFFGIVVAVQKDSGGNLAEAMQNLGQVLRDRKTLRGKVKAYSAEAKASAMIIAALPLLVMLMVYIMTPGYISLLWTDPKGQLMLMFSAVWMTTGVFVMKKMINFDY